MESTPYLNEKLSRHSGAVPYTNRIRKLTRPLAA